MSILIIYMLKDREKELIESILNKLTTLTVTEREFIESFSKRHETIYDYKNKIRVFIKLSSNIREDISKEFELDKHLMNLRVRSHELINFIDRYILDNRNKGKEQERYEKKILW